MTWLTMLTLALLAAAVLPLTCYVSGSTYNQRTTWFYKSKTPTHLLDRARAYVGDESRMAAFMTKAARGVHDRYPLWYIYRLDCICELMVSACKLYVQLLMHVCLPACMHKVD